jgi:hypothetical protein
LLHCPGTRLREGSQWQTCLPGGSALGMRIALLKQRRQLWAQAGTLRQAVRDAGAIFHAHDAQTPRQVLQFLRGNNRLPKAPQVLSTGRPWSDAGKLCILLRVFTVVLRAVGRIQKRYSLRHDVFPSCKV